jgi:RHS repeat-associated protein
MGGTGSTRRSLSAILVVTVCAGSLVAAVAPPVDPGRQEQSVPGQPLVPAVRHADPEATASARPAPVWPAAVQATVTVPAGRAVRVADSNLSVSRPAGGTDPRVQVQSYPQEQVAALGGVGSAFELSPAPGQTPQAVTVSVDYSSFRYAAGGDFVHRLGLRRLPACALAHPDDPGCRPDPTPVDVSNDTDRARLDATVTPSADAIYLLAASASGDTGDYRATDLRPSGKWSVGQESGDFTYSYPIPMPPPPYGKAPELALSYSAQSVDGRTSATNNQASWAGLGWELDPGFIERKYRFCQDDGSPTLSDLCWHSPYSGDEDGAEYVISLNGSTTELLKDSTGRYHAKDDAGWRIEHQYDGANSDNSSEAWVVSTSDGTRYFFGYHEDSNLTVPVVGNDTGEPCHASAPAPCRQTYRWALDEIRDVNENSTRFSWTKETNFYKRFSTGSNESYDRGSYLDRVEYGSHAGEKPLARVVLASGYRCAADIAKAGPGCAAPTRSSTGSDYPDVPVDLICTSGQSCTENSPSFFLTRRLTSIRTEVWDPPSATYLPVQRVQPTFALPNPEGETGPMLWLNYLQVSGSFGGESTMLPATDFDGAYLRNRVDYPAGQPTKAMPMRRITLVQNGLGGQTSVHYGHGSAAATCPSEGGTSSWESGKHWDTNDQECFRVDYRPENATTTTHGVFHKYVVTSVDQVDTVGGSPAQTTVYDYLGAPAWHYDDDMVTPADQQMWADWRGYGTVRQTTGSGPNDQRTVTETTGFRGMDGDRLASGGAKQATVTDWAGTVYNDNHAKAGQTLQIRRYRLTPGGTRVELSSDRSTFWDSGVTADGPGLHNAHMIRTENSYHRDLRADGSWRTTRSTSDGYSVANGGLATRKVDYGDEAVANDDTCTEVRYAQNTEDWRWMLNYPESVETHSGGPDAQSGECPGAVIARTVTLYDHAAAPGTANKPIDGNPTETRHYPNDTAYNAELSGYDDMGRVTTSTDGRRHTTTTSYSPATGWPLNGVTVTNPLGQSSTTVTSRAFGLMTRTTDPNKLVTTVDYDGAGRIRRVWLPTEPKPTGPDVPPPTGAVPSSDYAYRITLGGTEPNSQPTKPTVVTSRRLQTLTGGAPGWLPTYTYLDGFGRTREVQAPSTSRAGGRTITVTTYDDRGLTRGASAPIWNSTAPGDNPDLLLNPARTAVPSWTEATYDALSRETSSTLYGAGQTVSTTTTANYGDGKIVTPPRGGRIAYWNDGHDRLARVQENVPAGSDVPPPTLPTTTYAYTLRGELSTITDAAGNTMSYGYDWLSRRTSTKDPDAGSSTSTFDPNGNVESTTDAKGVTLAYTYDELDRKRTEWSGGVGGTKLAEWTYDSVPGALGQLATATRITGGKPYTLTVTGYDPRYRPAGRTWTIPSDQAGAPNDSYTFTYGYDRADHQTSVSYPPAGGLAAETVTTAYSAAGVPDSVTSDTGGAYVKATDYSGSGQLAQRSFGPAGAVQRRYTYQQTGARLLSVIETVNGENRMQADSYGYDEADNLTSVTDQTQPEPQSECYQYDSLQRLSAAWTTTANCATGPGSADNAGVSPYRYDYAFDAVGDLKSVTGNGVTRTYTRPTPGPAAIRPHAVTAVGADTYGYDPDGRLAGRRVAGKADTLAWNDTGTLASVVGPSGTTSFVYDADGTRLVRRDPTATTLYTGGMELRRTGTTTSATRYYSDGTAVVAMRTTSSLTWLGSDQQNSAQVAVDSATGTLTRQRYLPYGSHRGGSDDLPGTDRGFLGRTEDASTGLVQAGARYYDPSLGVFASPDPLYDQTEPQSLNPYSYAEGNPTTLSDPTGLRVCDGTTGDFSCAPGQRPDGKDKPKKKQRPSAPPPCWTWGCLGGGETHDSNPALDPPPQAAPPPAQPGVPNQTKYCTLRPWDMYCRSTGQGGPYSDSDELDELGRTLKDNPPPDGPPMWKSLLGMLGVSVGGCVGFISSACGEVGDSPGTPKNPTLATGGTLGAPPGSKAPNPKAYVGKHRMPANMPRTRGARPGLEVSGDVGITSGSETPDHYTKVCLHIEIGGCFAFGSETTPMGYKQPWVQVTGGVGIGFSFEEWWPFN